LILASEAPSQGTLLVDRPSFHASNRGRFLEATLQEWGIVVPRFVLDGRSDDWTAIPALIEWGSSFVPKEGAWSAGIPRPRALQAVDREGALWIRFTFESKPFPQGASAFLLIRRPGATIGWPWSGEDLRVFSWNANPEPLVAGSLRRAEGVLEAMIPWDRFPPAVGSAWTKVPSEWVLEISGPSGSQAYTLGSLVWGDLP